VDHNELVDAPALQLARVARILGLPVDRDAPTVFSSGLLDPSLRPTRYSDDEIGPDPACDPMVSEVYAALRTQALASSAPDPDLWRRLASKWQSSLRRREGLPNFSSASVAEN